MLGVLEKPFGEISADDIETLVANKVREGVSLEYKSSLPSASHDDRKEFLADISSFANASGGLLIYGVTEERDDRNVPTGQPSSIDGLRDFNPDKEILRLQNMLRDSIDPRIPGLQMRALTFPYSDQVLLIQVPQSFQTPHAVALNHSCLFWARSSNGKHPLDVREVTSLVLQSNAIPRRLQDFRTERLFKIASRETPVPIQGNPVHVVHLVPIGTFSGAQRFDISVMEQSQYHLRAPGAMSSWDRFNLDGYLCASSDQRTPAISYSQMFRNGAVEIVTAREDWVRNDKRYIPSTGYERYVFDDVRMCLELFSKLGISPPVVIFASILGVKDAVLITRENEQGTAGEYVFGTEHLLLPDVTLHDYSQSIPLTLRPVFDVLWQAGGFPRSLNFTPEGEWSPRLTF